MKLVFITILMSVVYAVSAQTQSLILNNNRYKVLINFCGSNCWSYSFVDEKTNDTVTLDWVFALDTVNNRALTFNGGELFVADFSGIKIKNIPLQNLDLLPFDYFVRWDTIYFSGNYLIIQWGQNPEDERYKPGTVSKFNLVN